jgi:hypothetical protein
VHDSELRLGQSLLRGPAGHDPHFGTCRIEVGLARGPLRPPVRMRLDIGHWSATATALALIPCQRVHPTVAYFRAGHQRPDATPPMVPLLLATAVFLSPTADYCQAARAHIRAICAQPHHERPGR